MVSPNSEPVCSLTTVMDPQKILVITCQPDLFDQSWYKIASIKAGKYFPGASD
jgi:hypothetical protein